MKKGFIFTLFALSFLLMLSGCVTFRTASDCNGMTKGYIVNTEASFGQNFLHTDDAVATKANITCWHDAAIGYAIQGQNQTAVQCCGEILYTSSDVSMKDVLWSEYALCIEDVAERTKYPDTCNLLSKAPDPSSLAYSIDSCKRRATVPSAQLCISTLFVFLPAAAFLFCSKTQGAREPRL